MRFEDVLPALRDGKAIQRTGQPVQWAYLQRSENGAFHWYGYGDDPDRGVPMNLDHTHLLAEDWVIVGVDEARSRRPAADHNCPRRVESFRMAPEGQTLDHWSHRNGRSCCSYCGSLNPDELMELIEAGAVRLGPTDKNYKVYVEKAPSDELIAMSIERQRTSEMGQAILETKGQAELDKWLEEQRGLIHGELVGSGKFYFQHFSPEQQERFVKLLNEKKLKIGYPGHFYRMPFFIQLLPAGGAA